MLLLLTNYQAPSRSIDDVRKIGICMTDVGVKSSRLPFAGTGLYLQFDDKKTHSLD